MGKIPLPAKVEGMGLTIIRDLIESVKTDRQPRASIYDGRQALEVAIALRESHRSGGVRVNLPLADRSLQILSAEIKNDEDPARVRRSKAS